MYRHLFFCLVIIFIFSDTLHAEYKSQPNASPLCLNEAIQKALEHNPDIHRVTMEIEESEGRVQQASLWPNPTLDAEAENFSGDNPGFNYSENTFSITQPLILGAKLEKQRTIAEKEKAILLIELEAVKREIIMKTEQAFYDVLLEQKRTELAERKRAAAQNRISALQKKPPVISPGYLNAEIALQEAEMDLRESSRNLSAAKRKLISLLGSRDVISVGECTGTLDRPFQVPEIETLKDLVEQNNTALLAGKLKTEKEDWHIALAKAERIPDIDLGFGVRQFAEDDTYAFVAAVSIPLPVFNRNQGAIREALVTRKRVLHEKQTTKRNLLLELEERYEEFETLLVKTDILKTKIIPTLTAYRHDLAREQSPEKHDHDAVFEAAQNLFEAHGSLAETLCLLHSTIAGLENIAGITLHGEKGDIF